MRLAQEGAQLIVTVDCGAMAYEALGAARAEGVDVKDVRVLEHPHVPVNVEDAQIRSIGTLSLDRIQDLLDEQRFSIDRILVIRSRELRVDRNMVDASLRAVLLPLPNHVGESARRFSSLGNTRLCELLGLVYNELVKSRILFPISHDSVDPRIPLFLKLFGNVHFFKRHIALRLRLSKGAPRCHEVPWKPILYSKL